MKLQQSLTKKYLERFNQTGFDVQFESGEEFHIGVLPSKFKVIIHDSLDYKTLLTSTSLALGEAYMDGSIEIEGDLFETLNEILSQMDQFTSNPIVLKKILRTSLSSSNQKKEVCSHYDIGNDFYKLWLDHTMSYSCAYFQDAGDTLYDAQLNKIEHTLKKLNLQEGMSLLDIGCGWGFLLIAAAKKYKVHGVGITLSKEQFDSFSNQIKEEGLEDYLEVKLMDYRDLPKSGLSFDRVVSVGMLEHVGREHYKLFFECVDSVLKKHGVFLLHFISSLHESDGDAWIKKYIFPGGVIPSLREIITLSSDYHYYVVDVESLRRHYVKTLLCWYENFENELPKIREQFDEEFIRMWRMYLCSCAASFNNGIVDLHQILLTKGINQEIPMTRDYMY